MTEIIDKVVILFKELPDKIKEKLANFKETITGWVSDAKVWIDDNLPEMLNNILEFFDNLPDKLINVGVNMIKGLWNGILSVGNWLWDKLSGYFGGIWDAISDLFTGLGDGYEASMKRLINLPLAASLPGQLFVANEGGRPPEFVGSMGNRTAVAHNDQIVEGIATGGCGGK